MKNLLASQPPMTDEERRDLEAWRLERWHAAVIAALPSIAGGSRKAARELAKQVAELTYRHEAFGHALRTELSHAKRGRRVGRRPVVEVVDDLILLIDYYYAIFHGDTRAEAKAFLARKHSRSLATINNRLSQARKGSLHRRAISPDELPESIRGIAIEDWPSRE